MLQKEFNYTASLKLSGKKCVIIGGGKVAARKLQSLLAARAQVTVIAPEFCEELLVAAQNSSCVLRREKYAPAYLQGAFLTVAATDDIVVNREVTASAPALCNNITEPELGNFIVPAVFTRGNISVAVTTGGMPAYTRRLKKFLAAKIGDDFAAFDEFLLTIRQRLKSDVVLTPEQRTAFWRAALTDEVINLLEQGQLAQAKEHVLNAFDGFRLKS